MTHLYLYNDHEHSFTYVHACLVRWAEYNPLSAAFSAEQCCMIAHNVGKAHIKQGDFMEMNRIKNKLEEKGLKVELHNELL